MFAYSVTLSYKVNFSLQIVLMAWRNYLIIIAASNLIFGSTSDRDPRFDPWAWGRFNKETLSLEFGAFPFRSLV